MEEGKSGRRVGGICDRQWGGEEELEKVKMREGGDCLNHGLIGLRGFHG